MYAGSGAMQATSFITGDDITTLQEIRDQPKVFLFIGYTNAVIHGYLWHVETMFFGTNSV